MPVMGIIYGAQSGIIRRLVRVDDLNKLAGHTGAGETLLIVPAEQIVIDGGLPDLAAAIAKVQAATGKSAAPERVGVLDNKGKPAGTLMADVLLDTLPNKSLVKLNLKRHVVFAKEGSVDKITGLPAPTDVVIDVRMLDPDFDDVPDEAYENTTAVKGDKPTKTPKPPKT